MRPGCLPTTLLGGPCALNSPSDVAALPDCLHHYGSSSSPAPRDWSSKEDRFRAAHPRHGIALSFPLSLRYKPQPSDFEELHRFLAHKRASYSRQGPAGAGPMAQRRLAAGHRFRVLALPRTVTMYRPSISVMPLRGPINTSMPKTLRVREVPGRGRQE